VKWRKGADDRYHQILIFGLTSLRIPINSVVYLVKELLPNKCWFKMLLGTTMSLLVIHTRSNRTSTEMGCRVLIVGRITLQSTNGPISMVHLPPSHSRRECWDTDHKVITKLMDFTRMEQTRTAQH
jgi:hypothetical protein